MDEESLIQVDRESFDKLKELFGNLFGDKCDFCGDEINKDNFGLLAEDITSCRNIVCQFEAYDKFEERFKDSQFQKEDKV